MSDNNLDLSIIGQNIKKARTKLGLSQQEVADLINVNRSTYSNYENNIRQPDIATLIKISNKLKVSLESLLGIETTNSANYQYSIPHCDKLISTYLNGILSWSEDSHLSLEESRAIKEHFSELLLKYKEIIERFTYSKIKATINHTDLSKQGTVENFYSVEIGTQLKQLAEYIEAFPSILDAYLTLPNTIAAKISDSQNKESE